MINRRSQHQNNQQPPKQGPEILQYQQQLQSQQESYLSTLQNLSNYLKTICLHIQATIKDPYPKDYPKNLVQNFDKAIEQYNNYYLKKRYNKNYYFKIDPVFVGMEQKCFFQRIVIKEKVLEDFMYFLKLVYVKGQDNYYKMHVEVWKQQGFQQSTNQLFTRFQKIIMLDLIDSLLAKGFVSHYAGDAIYLKGKRPNVMGSTKNSDGNNNLIEFIEAISQVSFKQLINNLKLKKKCANCQKYMIYQWRGGLFMPPTIKISVRQDKNVKNLYLHEPCCVRLFKKQQKNVQKYHRIYVHQQNQVHQQHQQHHHQNQQHQPQQRNN